MTRPTSYLSWIADPADAHAVRVRWVGAPWHYTIHWGDGTTDRVLFWQGAKKHTYPKRGTYTVTCIADIHEELTISDKITVRDTLKPKAVFELIEGTRTVAATLALVDLPIGYEVQWGDGRVTEHNEHDLGPQHEYPAGIGTPLITVVDRPARRVGVFEGPQIPDDDPEPEPKPRTVWRATSSHGAGRLELFGLPPSHSVELGGAGYGDYRTPPATITTDGNGRARRDYTLWNPKHPWMDDWLSIPVRWLDPGSGRWRQLFQPVQICEWIGGPRANPNKGTCWEPYSFGEGHARHPCNDIPLTIDWELGAPYRITVRSAPAENGTWTVRWTSGGTPETVEVTRGFFEASHDYGSNQKVWIVVTDPSGAKARRLLRPLEPRFEVWKGDTLAIFQKYRNHTENPCERGSDCDPYQVMRLDAGDGRPLAEVMVPAFVCPDRSGNGLEWASPGTYEVRLYAPMTDTISHPHQVRTRSGRGDSEFPIKQDVYPPTLVSQTFHVGALNPTSYTGWFEIKSESTQDQPWTLEFTLDAPALLADIYCWRGTATKHDLGGGRWRITCDQNVKAGDPTKLDITVDPCGSPRVYPSDVVIR